MSPSEIINQSFTLPFGVTISNRIVSIFFCYFFLPLFTNAQVVDTLPPPNIILIVADDMGWNDVGYHGSKIRTPTIDRLAKEGVELNRFYVHPSCSPTRSSLMTGKAALRLGFLMPLGKNNVKGLPLSEKIMPQYFKENGYQTNLVGKWHLGRFKKEHWPQNRGFDHFYGYLTGGVGHYDHVHGGGYDWQRNGKTIREEGYSTHLLTAEAVKLIKEKPADKPLFLEVCYAAPHLPNEAPEAAIAAYHNLPDSNRQIHAAMVTEVDKGIQEIYEALAQAGLLDNSIIWFTSDNGGLNPTVFPKSMHEGIDKLTNIFGTPLPIDVLEFTRGYIKNGAADNTPLRAGKGTAYEGAVRVPSFIYAPNRLQANKINSRLTVNDVLPTLANAARLNHFNPTDLDGVNQWDFLTQQTNQAVNTTYIIHGSSAEAFYKDNWKLVVFSGEEKDSLELYNVADDPSENNNVIAQNGELANTLLKEYKAFPRGAIVDDPVWKMALGANFFGGAEDREPYASLEGVNAGPLHPIYYIVPAFFLLLFLFIRWIWKRRRRRKNQP